MDHIVLPFPLHYYADAKQSAIELRTNFFLFFYIVVQIVTQVVIGYTYIVANGSSYCFFLIGFKDGRLHAVSFETASRDTQTLNFSRSVPRQIFM